MAKHRKDSPPDRFSATELAVAARLSSRNFALLDERYLLPEPLEGGGEKGRNRFWCEQGLAQIALIGGFYQAGVNLLLSASLAHAIFEKFLCSYGFTPSRIDVFIRESAHNPNRGGWPWGKIDGDFMIHSSHKDEFWIHHFLRVGSTTYRPGKSVKGDLFIEIFDKTYVFENDSLSVPEFSKPEPAFRIIEWMRGEGVTVRPLNEEVSYKDREKIREIATEFEEARVNAVGLIRVNISLAIRNGFDAIHDFRLQNGSQFDWLSSAHKGNIYGGCTPSGYPLDPNHPWNIKLPADERTKRLEEIDKYIAKLNLEKNNDG